ncbi:MAG: amidohydrolase family protein, partial [Symploca sp. SIO1B1]|nr:amidohydrolase family protein [Symploca sp. SIO1B1]
ISIEPGEPYLAQVMEYIGTDNIIFGSDYPHMDHKPDIVAEMVKLEETLSKEMVQKILWDNPRCFYSLF